MTRTQFDVEKELEEYRKFAFGRNMVGVAIALVLANTCQKMVNSISEHILMPIVNFFVSNAGSNWKDIKIAVIKGLELDIGILGASMIEFIITTLVVYVLYFKFIKVISPDTKIPD